MVHEARPPADGPGTAPPPRHPRGRVGVIVGSTRPTRICADLAEVAAGHLGAAGALTYELVDLATIGLPFLDEPRKPALGGYAHAHTRAWSAVVRSFDGFVLVFPQYNWGYPAVLKNALDFLYEEWRGKPAAIVSYGSRGGSRAAEQMRTVLTGLHMNVVAGDVLIRTSADDVDDTGALIDAKRTLAPYRDALAAVDAELSALLAPTVED